MAFFVCTLYFCTMVGPDHYVFTAGDIQAQWKSWEKLFYKHTYDDNESQEEASKARKAERVLLLRGVVHRGEPGPQMQREISGKHEKEGNSHSSNAPA